MNQVTARCIVGSVQTLRNAKRREQVLNVGFIIVDECHLSYAPTYRTILEHFGAFPSCSCGKSPMTYEGPERDCPEHGEVAPPRVAGFTATLARGNNKEKLSEIWEECTFSRGIGFFVRRGYLLDVRGKRIVVPDFDLSKVKKSGGDYAESALAEELERTFAPRPQGARLLADRSDR